VEDINPPVSKSWETIGGDIRTLKLTAAPEPLRTVTDLGISASISEASDAHSSCIAIYSGDPVNRSLGLGYQNASESLLGGSNSVLKQKTPLSCPSEVLLPVI